MRKTAANLLLVQDWRCLAVSRRDDASKWGLPGGKVDSGESNLNACLRETLEEVGLWIHPSNVTPIVSMCSTGDVDYWTTTYLYTGPRIDPNELIPERGLFIGFLDFEELADPRISPFAEYNKVVQLNYKLHQGI